MCTDGKPCNAETTSSTLRELLDETFAGLHQTIHSTNAIIQGEHTYRSLALMLLQKQMKENAQVGMLASLSGDTEHCLDVVDSLKTLSDAANWLVALPKDLCPEVEEDDEPSREADEDSNANESTGNSKVDEILRSMKEFLYPELAKQQ